MDPRENDHPGEPVGPAPEPIEARGVPVPPYVRPVEARPISISGDFSPDMTGKPFPFELAPLAPARFPFIDQPPGGALLDLAIAMLVMIAFALYSDLRDLPGLIAERVPSVGPIGWVFFNGVIALICVTVISFRRGQSLRSMGLRGVPLRKIVPVALLAIPAVWATGIACNVIYFTFQVLRGISPDHLLRDRLEFVSVISEIEMHWVAPIAIFVGIYEEIFFRGFVLPKLASATRSRWAGVILSSLLFGAVHFTQGWLGIFQTTCLGMVLAGAAVMGRSLWPAILAHVAIDTISLAMSVFLRSDISSVLRELTTTQAGS